MSPYPKHDEPFTQVGFYAANSQKYGGAGWVVIAWGPDSTWMAQVIGPFPDQTKARAYGRKHHPRRYKVAGIHKPKAETAPDVVVMTPLEEAQLELDAAREALANVEHGADPTQADERYMAALVARNAERRLSS